DVLVDARSEASSEPAKPATPPPPPVVALAPVASPPALSPALDEPASIEMSAPRSVADAAELLAVTQEQEQLARQITSRPPVKPPAAPVPSTNGGRPPRPAGTSGGGGGAGAAGGAGGGTFNLLPR